MGEGKAVPLPWKPSDLIIDLKVDKSPHEIFPDGKNLRQPSVIFWAKF
jgi:hypothetical protein